MSRAALVASVINQLLDAPEARHERPRRVAHDLMGTSDLEPEGRRLVDAAREVDEVR